MNAITTKRTQSTDACFNSLIAQLDADLNARYERVQSKYDQYNKIVAIDTVVVAFDGDKPVGCGCFKEYDAESVEMKRMFVAPDYRGRKISKLILEELEKWAGELGYSKAVIETGYKQHEAIGLYSKNGYGRIENYGPYKDFPESLCFEKLIAVV
ncbi:GNAT family N-acetyltransferase [uncultured Bacteroides sp.]|uniref:GNAT family N-acetyltransferase n=1 Tax=uncultured Bacteroides sp. TaxID=162156 RepID=UPI002AAAEB3E|nr:GNAT family N-acetyltransferase [uncultured Bacteroides sp.]